jgi:hypothetical protein
MEPLKSMCLELNAYLERKRENPLIPYAQPSGSFNESRKCGCRYCYIACQSVGGFGDVDRNKAVNRDAVAKNSGLSFAQPGDDEYERDRIVGAEFRSSGINFGENSSSREVFVLDRELDEIEDEDMAHIPIGADDPIIPVSASISGDTGSDQSFLTAFKWFETCVKEHTALCPKIITEKGKPPLPCRIVDVEACASQDVRLVETDGFRGHYACLSHCWGGEQPLKTTLKPDTLTEHRKEIKWEALPKTFQDAIIVARKFGIKYLWIDSLCIIQDSPQDWQVQSALMGEIYRNAVITIAGSASSGPRQGLFRTADIVHLDQPFPVNENLEELDKIRGRVPLSHNASELPLLRRGWVLQERLLSSRYLHFGQNELIWECMEHLTCECGSLSLKDPYRYKWLEPKNRLHPETLGLLKRLVPEALRAAWRATVVDYSRMELSHQEDLFPAISGIAKSIKEVTGWKYVAGLWKETLITDLVWRTEKPRTAARCKDWRAPTFSWASVVDNGTHTETDKSHISYAFMDVLSKGLEKSNRGSRTDLYATIVETKCAPVGGDVTGQLRYGFIVLHGTLIRAALYHAPFCDSGQWQIGPVGKEPLSTWSSLFCPDFDFNDTECGIRGGNIVYCLKLIGHTQARDTGNGEYLLYLVLRMIGGGGLAESAAIDGCTFERIALLRDARGPDDIRLEDVSEGCAIRRGVSVKIV